MDEKGLACDRVVFQVNPQARRPKMLQSFQNAVAKARQHDHLVFASLLSEDRIHNALGEARLVWQGWIYTPAVTVWVFLSQCLSQDHSCRDAVARLIGWRMPFLV